MYWNGLVSERSTFCGQDMDSSIGTEQEFLRYWLANYYLLGGEGTPMHMTLLKAPQERQVHHTASKLAAIWLQNRAQKQPDQEIPTAFRGYL